MLGMIGVGNMASAILDGILKNNPERAEKIGLYDTEAHKARRYASCVIFDSVGALARAADVLFLCVKPANFPLVLEEIGAAGIQGRRLFVSIAAGISTASIRDRLGSEAAVIRVMPNTPLLLGKGISALARNDTVTDREFEEIRRIFLSLGEVILLEEDRMNAIISLTSSSPAYLYLFAKAMAEGAARQGFDYNESVRLAASVFEGAAAMLKQSGQTPQELIRMVASPGGTTLAALDVLYRGRVEQTIIDAMLACTKRADELAGK